MSSVLNLVADAGQVTVSRTYFYRWTSFRIQSKLLTATAAYTLPMHICNTG